MQGPKRFKEEVSARPQGVLAQHVHQLRRLISLGEDLGDDANPRPVLGPVVKALDGFGDGDTRGQFPEIQRGDPGLPVLGGRVERGDNERLLGRPPTVDRRTADARIGGDVTNGQAREACGGQPVTRGAEHRSLNLRIAWPAARRLKTLAGTTFAAHSRTPITRSVIALRYCHVI